MKNDEITRTEVKLVKRVFEQLDEELEHRTTKTENFSEKELKKYHTKRNVNMILLGESLAKLKHYEVSYESFVRFIDDEKYLEILAKGYEEAKGYQDVNYIRLAEKPRGSERKAKNQLKDMCKKMQKSQGLITRVLFKNELEKSVEEFIYEFRDWLIYGIEDLIEEIEPIRQEYIITRRGNVKVEEVEAFMASKFDIYELYSDWVIDRRAYAIAYYPGLKMD